MKVSEKTLELNVCAQAHTAVHPHFNLLWFGLTQRQEARWGFDACTRLKGRLLIFQFKASDHVLRSGERKFQIDHKQLLALQRLVGSSMRSLFYAFPLVGNTTEFRRDPDLLSQTWLLDIAAIPAIGPPTNTRGGLRANRRHNVYVVPKSATIRSDPIEMPLIRLRDFAANGFEGFDGVALGTEDAEKGAPANVGRFFSRGARGVVVYRGSKIRT